MYDCTPWCALLHEVITVGCPLIAARTARAGAPVDGLVWCVECGDIRPIAPRRPWRRDWSGNPVCPDCQDDLGLTHDLAVYYHTQPATAVICFASHADTSRNGAGLN